MNWDAESYAERRILASRETEVELRGFGFTIRRLAELPLARLRRAYAQDEGFIEALVYESVVGWSRVTESDLFPGGSDAAVAFTPRLFRIWVEDQTEFLAELSRMVVDAYSSAAARRAESSGN